MTKEEAIQQIEKDAQSGCTGFFVCSICNEDIKESAPETLNINTPNICSELADIMYEAFETHYFGTCRNIAFMHMLMEQLEDDDNDKDNT